MAFKAHLTTPARLESFKEAVAAGARGETHEGNEYLVAATNEELEKDRVFQAEYNRTALAVVEVDPFEAHLTVPDALADV